MRQICFYILSVISLITVSSLAISNTEHVESVLNLNSDFTSQNIGSRVEYLIDHDNLDFPEKLPKYKFISSDRDIIGNSSYSGQNSSIWVRFRLKCNIPNQNKFYLTPDNTTLDKVTLFEWSDNAMRSTRILETGDYYNHEERPILASRMIIPLDLDYQREKTFYLKITTKGFLQTKISINSEKWLYRNFVYNVIFQVVLYGFCAGIIIASLISLYATKDVVFMYLALMMFSSVFCFLSVDGYGFMLFWKTNTYFQQIALPLSICFLIFLACHAINSLYLSSDRAYFKEKWIINSQLPIFLIIGLDINPIYPVSVSGLYILVFFLLGLKLAIKHIKQKNKGGWAFLYCSLPFLVIILSFNFIFNLRFIGDYWLLIYLKFIVLCQFYVVAIASGSKVKYDKSAVNKILEKRELSFENLINDLGEEYIIYSLDSKGVFTYISPSIPSLLNLNVDEILGRKWFEIEAITNGLTREEIRNRRNILKSIEREKMSPNYEFVYITPSGREIIYEANDNVIVADDGTIMGYEGMFRDITKQKNTAKKLQDSKEQAESTLIELQESNSQRKQMLTNISHKLRSPLNAIVGHTKVIQSELFLPDDISESLEIVSNSGIHLLKIIDSILEINSSSDLSNVSLNDFSMRGLLSDLEKIYREESKAKGISLEFRGVSRIPDFIRADQKKLRVILSTLFSNAIKYTNSGGVVCRISANDYYENEIKVTIQVQDTGSGIDESLKDKIFLPFGVEGEIRKKMLSLPLSKEYAKQMGGDIIFSSQVNEGANFQLEFKATYAEKVLIEESRLKATGIKGKSEPIRILVIERDLFSYKLIEKMIGQIGFSLYNIKNVGEIESIVLCDTYDLAIVEESQLATFKKKTHHTLINLPYICLLDSDHFCSPVDNAPEEVVTKPLTELDLLRSLKNVLGIEYLYADYSKRRPIFKDRRKVKLSNMHFPDRRTPFNDSNLQNMSTKILVFEEIEVDLMSIMRLLRYDGYECIEITAIHEIQAAREKYRPDIFVLGIHANCTPEILNLLSQEHIAASERIPIIVITDSQQKENIGSFKKSGASAVLTKPIVGEQLRYLVHINASGKKAKV